jgi:HAD superfamily hydrolase (TIGR01490 family)
MPKSIALFDIDKTMYDGFSYFELLETQVAEGLLARQVLADARAAMQQYKSKLQDYETTVIALLKIYASGLKGVQYDVVLRSTKAFYAASNKFFLYVKPAIRSLRESHDMTIVTGEPQFVAEAVRERFSIQSYFATEYELVDGVFTGGIASYLASRHEKHDAIEHLMRRYGAKNSFAFGDSDGDIEMLRAVQYPICIHPTDELRTIAEEKGWYMPQIEEVAALVAKLNAQPS